MVMPSVRPDAFSIAWSDPVALIVVAGIWFVLWRRALDVPREAPLVSGVIHG
jgi:hypothetical protein